MSDGQPLSGDLDTDAAMREMMGFGSFATRRPREQPGISSPQDSVTSIIPTRQPRGPPANPKRERQESFSNAHLSSDGQTSPQTDLEVPPGPSIFPSANGQLSYAFAYPATNTFYTRAELNEWAQGKRNARGDMAYFKPAFISDDPWARLRAK